MAFVVVPGVVSTTIDAIIVITVVIVIGAAVKVSGVLDNIFVNTGANIDITFVRADAVVITTIIVVISSDIIIIIIIITIGIRPIVQ